MALYIAVTAHITVTQQLGKIFSCLILSAKFPCNIEVTLYITVTLPFPKGDRCTQWVERMTVREGLSPFSGIICEIVCSVGQEKFYICQEKVGKVQKLHVKHVHPFVIKHILLRNIQ